MSYIRTYTLSDRNICSFVYLILYLLSFLNPTLDGGMAAWGVALLSIFMILLGAAIGVVATVFYQRWKKQQGPLVTTNIQSNSQPM